MAFGANNFGGTLGGIGNRVASQIESSISQVSSKNGVPNGLDVFGNNLQALENSEKTSRDDNPDYKFYIINNDLGVFVDAFLPENFELAIQNDFDTPFSQGVSEGGLTNAIKAFAGTSLTTQSMTMQVWSGSSPVNITIPIVLTATRDTDQDVTQQVKTLMKLSMPRKKTGSFLITPPGPKLDTSKLSVLEGLSSAATDLKNSLLGGNDNSNRGFVDQLQDVFTNMKEVTVIQIGRFIQFPSVIIDNVSASYDTMFDRKGRAIRCSVSVSFRTFYTPLAEDIDKFFSPGSIPQPFLSERGE